MKQNKFYEKTLTVDIITQKSFVFLFRINKHNFIEKKKIHVYQTE